MMNSFSPVANPDAIVLAPNVRFTIFTSRLIRIEYSPTNQFEDHASQAFWYRQQPVPKFRVDKNGNTTTITTEHLRLKYIDSQLGFDAHTLSIEIFATKTTWHFGDPGKRDNLGGTTRTLDMADGEVRLDPGLMSRAGWSVVDDSAKLVFNETGWLMNRAHPSNQDIYFFGYGHDYKTSLSDFCKIAGKTPLIPRFLLGNWWSRYWAYSEQDLIDVVNGFKEHEIPLAVCVIDMDWHITETKNLSTGWTGYTWNRKLFPDPKRFLDWLHAQGLKTTLNIHPAEGIHPHEEQYEQMAQVMGVDPTSRNAVRFDITDPQFALAYFDILHHPLEEMGVDFWWIDWQQGTLTRLPHLDPLWWLNHLHYYDSGRDGRKRPFIFSRWGGYGNHRYPIGFSGDTFITWASLAFQPRFTSTAANVGYGWWSHDIGGHQQGVEEPELFARWVQFGLFSPILRLHSTANPYHDRRPWSQDAETFRITRDAMQLRHAFIPYIYSMAWRNHSQDLPLVTPMYWDHPDDDNAYNCPQQYMFGSELIAAPITTPLDANTRMARQDVWLPRGDWYNFFDGEYIAGDRWSSTYAKQDEIPVFAKAGAIVPLAPPVNWGGLGNPNELTIHIFAGADNRFELYEDDGETVAYTQGQYALTTFTQTWGGNNLKFSIEPARGDTSFVPSPRQYRLVFHGVKSPAHIDISSTDIVTSYDEPSASLTVDGISITPKDSVTITLTTPSNTLLSRRDRRIEKCRKMLRTFKMQSGLKLRIDCDLEKILHDPGLLHGYGIYMKDAHLAALKSVVS
ncbi:MAG: DUF5110 domain-containing protein [Chloroflexi bacterium]|nr:DUF5110 domain-containing protein [Chloroflexota bacterium]